MTPSEDSGALLRDVTAAAKSAKCFVSEHTGVIALQHLLGSTVPLFKALLDLGLNPDLTFVFGKGYSTYAGAADELRGLSIAVWPNTEPLKPGEFGPDANRRLQLLWRESCRRLIEKGATRIIVIDDGGRLHQIAAQPPFPLPLAGVEQTTSGIRRLEASPARYPIIDVARSAAKLNYESPLIAQAIINKTAATKARLQSGMTIGIVGVGSVGSALLRLLTESGYQVLAAEAGLPTTRNLPVELLSLQEVIARSNVVFGCTGTDIFRTQSFPSRHMAQLALCSCSSEDIEFLELIRHHCVDRRPVGWPAPDLEFSSASGSVRIIRGGYPVNFDSSAESVPARDIQLTRALMLAGVLTAMQLPDASQDTGLIQLPAALQVAVLGRWAAPELLSPRPHEPTSVATVALTSGGSPGPELPLIGQLAHTLQV